MVPKQHPLHLRVGSGESDGKVKGQLDLSMMHVSITPSHPAHGNEAQGTRESGLPPLVPITPHLLVEGVDGVHVRAAAAAAAAPGPPVT